MKERLKAWWTEFCKPDPEPPPDPPHVVTADAITTLAWCIFWGLVLHGCVSK